MLDRPGWGTFWLGGTMQTEAQGVWDLAWGAELPGIGPAAGGWFQPILSNQNRRLLFRADVVSGPSLKPTHCVPQALLEHPARSWLRV